VPWDFLKIGLEFFFTTGHETMACLHLQVFGDSALAENFPDCFLVATHLDDFTTGYLVDLVAL
jgi:hypothetical protein